MIFNIKIKRSHLFTEVEILIINSINLGLVLQLHLLRCNNGDVIFHLYFKQINSVINKLLNNHLCLNIFIIGFFYLKTK